MQQDSNKIFSIHSILNLSKFLAETADQSEYQKSIFLLFHVQRNGALVFTQNRNIILWQIVDLHIHARPKLNFK
jgi:hypothetical protein